MPEKIEIKSQEDLANHLGELNEKVDKAVAVVEEAKLPEAVEAIESLRTQQEETKTQWEKDKEDLLEKIKTVTLAKEAMGTWKTGDTEEAKCYGIGKLVHLMTEARAGSRLAHGDLVRMGCGSVKSKQDTWTDETGSTEEVREQYVNKDIVSQKAGLSSSPLTGDDAVGSYYGSYTVPVEYRAEMERIALDASAMMGLVTRIPVPGITSYIPNSVDELAFTAVTNQDTDKTEDNLTMGRATLTTVTYASYIAIVEEFFEDTLVAVGAMIRDMFGEAWGKKFDTLCLSDSTYGLVNTTGVLNKAMSTGDSSFDSLTPEYMHDMIKELDSRWKRNGAKYFIHVTNWDKIRIAKNADGDYYFGPITGDMPAAAWGYPVVLTDGMPDSGDDAKSTSFVALGNPRRIWNGFRVGFEFRIYDQTQSAMESGQIFLRVRTRQAFTTVLPTTFVKLTTAAS